MNKPSLNNRLYFLDNMRAIASIMGVIYHVALIFSSNWRIHINDIERGKVLYNVIFYLNIYRIPTFLFVAGFFTLYAVKKYNIREYIIRRFKRIVVPFIASCILLLPTQAWISLVFSGTQNLTHDFLLSINPFSKYFSMQHFWFLYDIVIFSFIGLFIYNLRKIPSVLNIYKLINKGHQNIYIIIFMWAAFQYGFLKLAKIYDAHFHLTSAWFTLTNISLYLPFFVFGCYYYLQKDLFNKLIINGQGKTILQLLILNVFLLILNFNISILGLFIETIFKWAMMLMVINLIKLFLNYSNKFLRYISDASYPFYILHQPVIILVAFFYVQVMPFKSILINYIILVIVCTLCTYIVYELLVRRTIIGKILFTGVFPQKKESQSILLPIGNRQNIKQSDKKINY